ncbi:CLUMA_CG019115, isoform A [Clunio marinus]|uniref:CLUMA_CG019115, isoform A n=1 Tax=Clunio marinus TaxID=568069 RepID=A0A1J1J179_9DIPT|nr:CLUMA_CG019115, isoform A [Clunio marinus]
MKAVLLWFAIIAMVTGDDVTDTTTDLLNAQRELTSAHERAESEYQINRNIISSYIAIVEQQLLDSFMDTYSEIHMLVDETTEIFNTEFESSPCIDTVRARWNLQVHRFGNRLSECLLNSVAEVNAWSEFVNNLHVSAQGTTNQFANAGVAELADLEGYVGSNLLSTGINERLVELLARSDLYFETFEEFRASVVNNEEEIIRQLTECDRAIAAASANEAREDLALARACT